MQTQIRIFASAGFRIEFFHFTGLSRQFRPHFHAEATLGCLLAGEREFSARGFRTLIKPFDLIALPPGVPHACRQLSGTSSEWLGLQLEVKNPVEAQCAVSLYEPGDPAPRLVRIMLEIHSSSHPGQELLQRLLINARQALALPVKTDPDERLSPASGCMRTSLAELAAAEGISRFHYLRRFSRQQGITPGRHETNCRLNQARSLLRHGAGIAACASDCGFCDQAHLSRQFGATFGIAPGQYRQAWLK